MTYAFEHPFHGAGVHPWDDPSVPQEPLNPRPLAEIGALAGTGPRPEDFRFNPEGRRLYYDAVRAEAQHLQHLRQVRLLEQRQREEEAARRAALLLLS